MIYIVGDTHGIIDIGKLKIIQRMCNSPSYVHENTYVIIVGDFGLIWDVYPSENEAKLKLWYNSMPFITLFLDGNHDNHERLQSKEFHKVAMFDDEVKQISEKVFYLQRGHIYNIEGSTFFCMGGAESIDKENRIEGISWWSEEQPNKAEMDLGLFNLNAYDNKVDYILTHTCSDYAFNLLNNNHAMQKLDCEPGLRKYFNHLEDIVQYKKWLFGHFHTDIQLDQKHTCLYNSLLETINGEE